MVDLYTQILGVLYMENLSKETQATTIRKIIEKETVEKFQELMVEYERECGR